MTVYCLTMFSIKTIDGRIFCFIISATIRQFLEVLPNMGDQNVDTTLGPLLMLFVVVLS
jgi:hypothetical protein